MMLGSEPDAAALVEVAEVFLLGAMNQISASNASKVRLGFLETARKP